MVNFVSIIVKVEECFPNIRLNLENNFKGKLRKISSDTLGGNSVGYSDLEDQGLRKSL